MYIKYKNLNMECTKHYDSLYTYKTNLNLEKLKDAALQIYEVDQPTTNYIVENQFRYDFEEITDIGQNTPCNFLMYPLPEIHSLYWTIHQIFHDCQLKEYGKSLDKDYFIQCWANVFYENRNFTWHTHTKNTPYSWHGFFCINAEPSVTSYRFRENNSEVKILDLPCKNNSITIGLSHYEHRTYAWEDDNNPRITIGFDIVPAKAILKKHNDEKLPDILKQVPILTNRFLPI